MSDKFQPINRYTTYLLPPSLQDWLPEKHLARFVVDIVDQLDLSRLVNHYGVGGKAPYHPALLLGLLFYGYATGVFSSRKLEQATHDSAAFRFITGDTLKWALLLGPLYAVVKRIPSDSLRDVWRQLSLPVALTH